MTRDEDRRALGIKSAREAFDDGEMWIGWVIRQAMLRPMVWVHDVCVRYLRWRGVL